MKLSKIIAAAGLAVAAVTMSSSASAQDYRHHRNSGYDQRHSNWDRGHHRGWDRWDRGHRHGWNRHHRNCRTMWRHHRRVTVCYR